MKTISYTTIDKVTWPRGVWDDEPDKMQWPDPATGLPCLAIRNRHFGSWCGYVGISPKHPAYGKDYDDVGADVHGGLNFANKCRPGATEAVGVCHVPEEGEPDHVWWLGFDCGHSWDFSPGMEKYGGATYRTLAYVQRQCARLAEQLAGGASV